MDIDEFTDTPSPNLRVTVKVNHDNMAGGYESYPLVALSRLTFNVMLRLGVSVNSSISIPVDLPPILGQSDARLQFVGSFLV